MGFLFEQLESLKYVAMFGILVLCGLGLPIPEEATLILSGVLVGLGGANFWLASAACVLGILVGDTVIFALGRFYGRRFLESRLMRWVLTEKRQRKIGATFAKHGSKAVFFARFFAGIRIGVYAYAGQHGMHFLRFLFLDLLGALISGPTSIWLGKFAVETIASEEADRDALKAAAKAFAERVLRTGHHWIYAIAVAAALLLLLRWLLKRRKAAREPGERTLPAGPGALDLLAPPAPGASSPAPPAATVPRDGDPDDEPGGEPALIGIGERAPREHTSGREAPRDGAPRSPSR